MAAQIDMKDEHRQIERDAALWLARRDAGGWGDRQILICGSPAMVEATRAALIAKGAPPQRIQHDPLYR